MLCQKCKEQEATTHIKENINGVKKEIFLCSDCASNYQEFNTSFLDFDKVFSNMFFSPAVISSSKALTCSQCGANIDYIEKTGKVGCEKCYEVFSSILNPYIKKIHGNYQYKGKLPKKAGEKIKVKRELEELKAKLKAAVEAQEYEKAAILRDKIKKLEA